MTIGELREIIENEELPDDAEIVVWDLEFECWAEIEWGDMTVLGGKRGWLDEPKQKRTRDKARPYLALRTTKP